MICSKCGHEIELGANICMGCGTPSSTATAALKQGNNKPELKWLKIGGIGCGGLLLLLIMRSMSISDVFLIMLLVSLALMIVGIISPKAVVRWGNKRARGAAVLYFGIASIVFFALFGINAPEDNQVKEAVTTTEVVATEPTQEEPQTKTSKPAVNGAKKEEKCNGTKMYNMYTKETECKESAFTYKLIDEEIYDVPNKTQVKQHYEVVGKPKEEEIESGLKEIYAKQSKRTGFKHHATPNSIAIYLYASRQQYESGVGQQFAQLIKAKTDSTYRIDIDERNYEAMGKQPEFKIGLSEDKRKDLFFEIVKCEDRANRESGVYEARTIDEIKKADRLKKNLDKKLKRELASKNGLTMEQLKQIGIEGVANNWPMPEN